MLTTLRHQPTGTTQTTLTPTPHHPKIVPQIAAMAFLLLFLAPIPALTQETPKPTPQVGLLTGLRFNDGNPNGLLGVVYTPSRRVSFFTAADFGPMHPAYQARIALNLRVTDWLHIHPLLGPHIEQVETDPSATEAITYLGASTGIALSASIGPNAALAGGVDYIQDEADISPWKFLAALYLAIDL